MKCEGMTSIWGKNVSSFDLPEDYVQDYLKELKAKKKDIIGEGEEEEEEGEEEEESPSLLMIAPRQGSKVKSRSGSFDVIPACLPESVGIYVHSYSLIVLLVLYNKKTACQHVKLGKTAHCICEIPMIMMMKSSFKLRNSSFFITFSPIMIRISQTLCGF